VLKPDHQTSLTALWAVDLLIEAGLPPEVLPVVTGEGPALGPALIAKADFVMFTGSTATGRVIAQQAAERLIGVSLELGGKNPMLVLADADLERAVDGASAAASSGPARCASPWSGSTCMTTSSTGSRSASRRRQRKLRLGAGLDYRAEMGSLTSERQLRTVGEHVADASRRARPCWRGTCTAGPGASLLRAHRARGRDARRCVSTRRRPSARWSRSTARSDEDAIRLANETAYGLSASVWSRDRRGAIAVPRRVRAGSVNVNEAYAATWGSTTRRSAG
jgi:succinate-semialdehyde dehydrogenase / glutarate-semialdehyde dehydrogenase